MAEPLKKRARRPDSKQMWNESDRHVPIQSRESDEPPRERKGDRDRQDRGDKDKDRRRYRSRSPRDSRDVRDGRARGWVPSGRDSRDANDGRGSGRGHDDEDRGGRRHRDSDRKGKDRKDRDFGKDSKDKPRQRSRSQDNDRRRSRSPRRDLERESGPRHGKKEKAKSVSKPEEELRKSRTATPPVAFRVGGKDHDCMDTDDHKQVHVKGGAKDTVEEESIDQDDDIVIEDDGMAAMQAMMGFGGFGTTHQKKVAGNDIGAVRKEKKTEYRQYMNRVGGFNRPLSPARE